MLRIVMSAFLVLIATACVGPRYVDYFPVHDDGTPKPRIALMPILDSSQNPLDWDLAEEISEGLYYGLMHSGEIYMVEPREMGQGWMNRQSIDFFSNDYSYARDFCNTDFIVAMEVMERSISAYDPCIPNNLTMTMLIRIKIVDIRFCEPKIVLYEVFKTSYTGLQRNGDIVSGLCWNDEAYAKTFCGTAHQRAINCLAKRLEEVIWSVK